MLSKSEVHGIRKLGSLFTFTEIVSCFVADQLRFMTRIREEEEVFHTKCAQIRHLPVYIQTENVV